MSIGPRRMNCYRSRRNLFRKATNLRDHFARYAARNLTRFQFRSMVTMLLVLTCVQTGVAQVELWTRQFGTRGNDIAHSAAVDRAGNIYIAGSMTGAFIHRTEPLRRRVPAEIRFWRQRALDPAVRAVLRRCKLCSRRQQRQCLRGRCL